MTALFIILGILLIAGGISCMCTPLLTFMNVGYFVVILIVVYGILGIISAIRYKRYGVGFVFSILSIIFGLCVLFIPQLMLFTDTIMVYMTAAWFVLFGIVTIINSVTITRLTGSGIWILQLILGILGILIGCYSFFHPMLMAVSLGVLMGIFFIETGITLIVSGCVRD